MSDAEKGADGEFDYVGITLARSVEGDALAAALAGGEGIEVVHQPSFNEVRAHRRLRLDFEQLSEDTGLEVDASLVEVLMSTYYGRMVNTDDALLLFHDPLEATEHM